MQTCHCLGGVSPKWRPPPWKYAHGRVLSFYFCSFWPPKPVIPPWALLRGLPVLSTMVYRWLYTYSPIFCIEFVSKLSRQSLSPSTDHQFNLWPVDGESDCRDSLLTNSMQTYGRPFIWPIVQTNLATLSIDAPVWSILLYIWWKYSLLIGWLTCDNICYFPSPSLYQATLYDLPF